MFNVQSWAKKQTNSTGICHSLAPSLLPFLAFGASRTLALPWEIPASKKEDFRANVVKSYSLELLTPPWAKSVGKPTCLECRKPKAQIPDILTCHMTLRSHLNFMDLISIICRMEIMCFAVSETVMNTHCTSWITCQLANPKPFLSLSSLGRLHSRNTHVPTLFCRYA